MNKSIDHYLYDLDVDLRIGSLPKTPDQPGQWTMQMDLDLRKIDRQLAFAQGKDDLIIRIRRPVLGLSSFDIKSYCPGVKALFLQECYVAFEDIPDLEYIHIGDLNRTSDLANNRKLKYVSTGPGEQLRSVHLLEQLETLSFMGPLHKLSRTRDIHELFSGLLNLRRLSVVRPGIESLDFLPHIRLEALGLYYARELINLDRLKDFKDALRFFSLWNAKRIVDMSPVYDLPNIEYFSIKGCSHIDTLSFIKEYKNLDFCNILDTPILDRDVRSYTERMRGILVVDPMKKSYY